MPPTSAGILLYRWRANAEGSLPATASSPVVGPPGRSAGRSLEVLLVHPGGPSRVGKGAGAWSIPKGEVEPGAADTAPQPAESWQRPAKVKPRLAAAGADLLASAKREFAEETGFRPDELAAPGAEYVPLGGIKLRGHKIVFVWSLEGDCDVGAVAGGGFVMERSLRSGRTAAFAEVDRAAWFAIPAAREAIVSGQRRFLDDLEVVAGGGTRT